jgi:hypothetical protein
LRGKSIPDGFAIGHPLGSTFLKQSQGRVLVLAMNCLLTKRPGHHSMLFASIALNACVGMQLLANDGAAKVVLAPNRPSIVDEISYTLGNLPPHYDTTGYVRVLEVEGSSASPSDAIASEYADPGLASATQTPPDGTPTSAVVSEAIPSSSGYEGEVTAVPELKLGPLVVPNTKTAGIGTGAMPQDSVVGKLPPPIALPTGATRETPFALTTKPWVPGGFCHYPLYWENPMLERHGHQVYPAIQPAVSGVRFFGTALILPYLGTLRKPLEDVHTLGAYRPGTPAPALKYRPYYSPKAIRNQIIVGAGVTAIAAP